MPSAPANHDPAFSSSPSNAPPSNIPAAGQNNIGGPPVDFGLDQNQIMSILRSLPNLPTVFNKLAEQGNLKEDAAQTLSNLSQATFQPQHQLPVQQHPYPGPGPHAMHHPGISDPGPSSHPRGPPNLGQLASAAGIGTMQSSPLMSSARNLGQPVQEMEEGASDGDEADNQSGPGGGNGGPESTPPSGSGGRTRGTRNATMGSDEWSRQRKDNHKEVERRRRGNINEGINELGRIVPNGSGEKAKGAILSRAVQYIHHLKENEARNIEKWTLEKLLMDQAMGDLQAQLEEVKRLWEEERMTRSRIENELRDFRSGRNNGVGQYGSRSRSPEGKKEPGDNREAGDAEDRRGEMEDGEGRLLKRPRLD